ncbi:MAG: CBS domain-containing protein [Halobacteria archaeon]|nr:CBS domain-containing protein [Halobacteria archaeon]
MHLLLYVKDLATEEVVTASPDDSVGELAKKMRDTGVGSLVIVEDDEPVGIVTDRDLSVRMLSQESDLEAYLDEPINLDEFTAEMVMSRDMFTVDADDGVFEVLDQMCERGVRRIPVVEDGELAGIVTLDDFVVTLATELSDVAAVILSESPE